jgi:hypothetical protein
MVFGFYSKTDKKEEIINRRVGFSRLEAAKYFADRKQLDLKTFLKLYAVKTLI